MNKSDREFILSVALFIVAMMYLISNNVLMFIIWIIFSITSNMIARLYYNRNL